MTLLRDAHYSGAEYTNLPPPPAALRCCNEYSFLFPMCKTKQSPIFIAYLLESGNRRSLYFLYSAAAYRGPGPGPGIMPGCENCPNVPSAMPNGPPHAEIEFQSIGPKSISLGIRAELNMCWLMPSNSPVANIPPIGSIAPPAVETMGGELPTL